MRLILASASPRRLDLLARIGVVPDAVDPAHIDESVPAGELPRDHALRLAIEKAEAVETRHPDALVLAADTVVAVGRRILPKVEDEATLARLHEAAVGPPPPRADRRRAGHPRPAEPAARLVETMIAMKRLSDEEIDYYAGHGEWHGKAGGYALQGYGEVYVRHIAGSYSNVVGLPLAETRHAAEVRGLSDLPEWLIERGIGETRAALVEDGRIVEARILRDGVVPAGTVLEARAEKRRPQRDRGGGGPGISAAQGRAGRDPGRRAQDRSHPRGARRRRAVEAAAGASRPMKRRVPAPPASRARGRLSRPAERAGRQPAGLT